MQKGDSAADCLASCEQQLLAAGVFFGHGTDNARDESLVLMSHVLDQAVFDQSWSLVRLDAEQIERLQLLMRRRIEKRIPAAYLIGQAWFCGLQFKVDERVLIPRSPIAELIESEFELWLHRADARVLDLCTGCACIAIATATFLPETRVDAADLSAAALALAEENVALHGLGDRVQLYRSDLFEGLGQQRYDLIISNPPYVGADEMSSLPGEYLQEPELALASGEDGLDIPLKILRDAASHLEDNGVLIMEVGNSDERLQSVLPRVPFLWLEFEYGGHGVLVLERRELLRAAADIEQLCAERKLVG